ncbi:MAG: pyridoxamine 5'-phosphate oxidase [Coxiella sp. RIFCSPHIGHO2_12_FULL_44_14]|nr:MAG: pyridoxamine 5'-phosphate oxidase [Coxiella sp. RIFCSPHIGHO2_12_FULL_44_14]
MTLAAHLSADPLEQFQLWYEEAKQSHEPAVDAMVLATADREGRPAARVVLYKGVERGGFRIYTNYHSRKARELVANPNAALVFYWSQSYKQVRIEGKVEKMTPKESERYFQTRPRESQLSAWVSEQSQIIPDRDYLTKRYRHYQQQFATGLIPCPPDWGGFLLFPERIEFWIGRDHRLHDRFCYQKQNGAWEIVRVAP